MGKIRSTLDIVMDRTRNLSMTQEERNNLKHKELADSAKAWVRKYLDNKMTLDDVDLKLKDAGEDRPELMKLLKAEFIREIRIGEENVKIPDALHAIWGISRDLIMQRIDGERAKLQSQAAGQIVALKEGLERQGIRGSSVVPNLATSKSRQDTAMQAQHHLTEELESLL